ncbi:Kielin/chordin-like protein, partial [Stegodyphus mimosarum]
MDPENACSECVCLDGMVSCHPVLCSNTECPNPQFGNCCETCDGCSYGEKNYINHAFFHDPYNPCRECQCDSGTVSCQQRSCDSPVCKDPTLANTECCSMCQDCMFKDGFFRHGENFTDPDDPCVKCSCQFSQVICEEHSCPEESCTNSLSSACCEGPYCSDCQFFEDMYTDGEVFTHPHDPCAVCICQSGHVTCFEQCPDIFCTHPVKTSCCDSCNEGCSLGNFVYDDYQVFPDTDNDCQECACLKGNITCKRISCPTPSCKHPSSDGCCSVCDDCFYKNEHFMNGESIYRDSSDPCQVCTCLNGNIECKFKTCATVYCSNPVIEDCCPVCHLGCLYDGEMHSFGAEFDHPNDPCYECACMEGSVHCSKKPCGPLNCSNPIYDSEACCPHCPNYCISNSKKYDLNSIIPHSSDVCQECKCVAGDVHCELKECPEVRCQHPAHGDCCLECMNCNFASNIYSNGTNFTNPRNVCETCICLEGEVLCSKKLCEPVNCNNPIEDPQSCCPYCPKHCMYIGEKYDSGETFSPSSD